MAEKTDNTMLFTAVYDSKGAALTDLDAIDQMHKAKMLGNYDAAVIDKEGGKPHIVKRADKPGMRVIPETFGSGALPRKDLKEAAQELTEGEAGLVVVGEITLEQGVEKALTHAVNVAKRTFDTSADQVSKELSEALKA